MFVSLMKVCNTIPCLAAEVVDANETKTRKAFGDLMRELPFYVLNPSLGIPKLYGMTYLYSLLPAANDIICPKSLVGRMTGVNSNSQTRSATNFEVNNTTADLSAYVKDFFTRASGVVEPSILNRINAGGRLGLSNFSDFFRKTTYTYKEATADGFHEGTRILLKKFSGVDELDARS